MVILSGHVNGGDEGIIRGVVISFSCVIFPVDDDLLCLAHFHGYRCSSIVTLLHKIILGEVGGDKGNRSIFYGNIIQKLIVFRIIDFQSLEVRQFLRNGNGNRAAPFIGVAIYIGSDVIANNRGTVCGISRIIDLIAVQTGQAGGRDGN